MPDVGGFLRQIPRRIGGLFYEDEPIISEELLKILLNGDAGPAPVDARTPPFVRSKPKKKSQRRRIAPVLQGLLGPGIAAAATPSTTGGPTDVFRGLMGAQGYIQGQEDRELDRTLAKIRGVSAIQNVQSRGIESRARLAAYMGQLQRARNAKPAPPADTIRSVGGGLYNVTKGKWEVEATTKDRILQTSGGLYNVTKGKWEVEPTPDEQKGPAPHFETRYQGGHKWLDVYEDGKVTPWDLGPADAPPRQPRQTGKRPYSPQHLAVLEENRATKMEALQDTEEDDDISKDAWTQLYDKYLAGDTGPFKRAVDSYVKRAQKIEDDYQTLLGKGADLKASRNMREVIVPRLQAKFQQWGIFQEDDKKDYPQGKPPEKTAESFRQKYLISPSF
ncbi:MAG: hypothetical protein GY906_22445 [bacterium]|nr:hypothetical protein [bacterium]